MAYLGVHVTLHPANDTPKKARRYKIGFIVCGILSVLLVIWQGWINGKSATAFQNSITDLQGQVSNLQGQEHAESKRRLQAENDLAIMVQDASRSTTEGVVSDLRQIDQEQALATVSVSVDLVYEDHQLRIYNRGEQNISLWGDQVSSGPSDIEEDPRMISPSGQHAFGVGDGFYYLNGDRLEQYAKDRFGDDGSGTIPLRLFLKDAANRKRTVKCALVTTIKQGSVKIETQNLGVSDGWLLARL